MYYFNISSLTAPIKFSLGWILFWELSFKWLSLVIHFICIKNILGTTFHVMLLFSDMVIRRFDWWLTALGHGLLLRVISDLSSFQESTIGKIQPLVSFKFVSCGLVDWFFHLPIWARGVQKRKMLAVVTGVLKRSSFWISYPWFLGNFISSWVTIPHIYSLSYLVTFLLMTHSWKMASLHDWLGLLATRSPCFQVAISVCCKLKFIPLSVRSS